MKYPGKKTPIAADQAATVEGSPDEPEGPVGGMVERVGRFSKGGREGSDPSDVFDDWVDLPAYRPSFGALLVRAGLASDADVKDAVDEGLRTGERLGEVVIRRGWASEERVAQLLSEQWQLPFVEADKVAVDPHALQRVPLAVARELRALPIGFNGTSVVLAVADPNEELYAEVARRVGDASFVVVARSVLDPLIESHTGPRAPDVSGGEAAPIGDDEVAQVAPLEEVVVEPLEPRPEEALAHEPLVLPAVEVPAAERYGPVESYETVAPEAVSAGSEIAGSRGFGVEAVGTVIESIDNATAGLGRVRSEVGQLGQSLRSAEDRLAEQQASLAAAAATHERDTATIRRLESELAQRADLFAQLKTQISTLTETLTAGAVEDRDPVQSSFGPD